MTKGQVVLSDTTEEDDKRGPLLHISLLWFGPIELRRAEVWSFLRHPVMLFFFLIVFAIIVIANNSPSSGHVPFARRAAIYALGPLISTAIVMVWIELRSRLAKIRPVRINLGLIIFWTLFITVPLLDYLQRLYVEPEIFSWSRLAAKIIFYGTLSEALLACTIVFFADGVLKELRSRSQNPATDRSAETPDQPPILRFRLFGLTPVESTYAEFLRSFVHPKVQIVFVLFFMTALAANFTVGSKELIALQIVFYLGGVIVGWAIWGLLVTQWWFWARPKAGFIEVPTSLLLVATTVIMTPLIDHLENRWITQMPFDWANLMARFVFFLTLSHICMAFVIGLLAKGILAETRDHLAETRAQTAVPDAVPLWTVGGVSFAPEQVLFLQARRNMVELVLAEGTHRVAGPLAERIAELPETAGRMVHRSIWVAEARIAGHRRDGRDIVLELDGGQTITIALSRQSELLPWLRDLAARRG